MKMLIKGDFFVRLLKCKAKLYSNLDNNSLHKITNRDLPVASGTCSYRHSLYLF